jgi:hypothetical protein
MPPVALSTPEIEKLSNLVEEGAQATRRSIVRFIEPARGTLQRASSKRHHIVFGRRGSGKTSLLLKAAEDLSRTGSPTAYVDLEKFKGHQYPDVLISILIEAFEAFASSLQTDKPHLELKRTLIQSLHLLISRSARSPATPVVNKLHAVVAELRGLLELADQVDVLRKTEAQAQDAVTAKMESGLSAAPILHAGASVEAKAARTETVATEETARRSKIEFLMRRMIDYSRAVASISESARRDAFLFLDDLYHIRRSDQPHVLDYFHRLFKGGNTWLKIGTVRHRSAWYLPGDPPIGLSIGDDADEINLDVTLEAFGTAKSFLLSILSSFISDAGAPKAAEFLQEGPTDRLVLGSGGVARDFLGIFRRSLEKARARIAEDPGHFRGSRVAVEDVNLAIGDYGDNKLQEFNLDTSQDHTQLDSLFQRIMEFCIQSTSANCFLVDQAASADRLSSLNELVDMRLVHLVRSHVTVSGRPGKLFKAYMLDFSVYTGERKRRDLQLVEFWRRGSEEQLRRARLIFPL